MNTEQSNKEAQLNRIVKDVTAIIGERLNNIVKSYVMQWFEDHPEILVEDGTIPKDKLALDVCRLLDKSNNIRTDAGFDQLDEINRHSTMMGAHTVNSPRQKNKGIKNNAFGIEDLWQATDASHNNCFGFHSQWRATTGEANCSFGNETLDNNQDGGYNCAFGAWTMKSELHNDWTIPVSINRNNAFGALGLYNTRGNDNSAFGYAALKDNLNGNNNLALGNYSGAHAEENNEFFLDNLDRGNKEDEKIKSMMYGRFAENPDSQTLCINAGMLFLPYLPTSDPHAPGALWNDNGALKISQSKK